MRFVIFCILVVDLLNFQRMEKTIILSIHLWDLHVAKNVPPLPIPAWLKSRTSRLCFANAIRPNRVPRRGKPMGMAGAGGMSACFARSNGKFLIHLSLSCFPYFIAANPDLRNSESYLALKLVYIRIRAKICDMKGW